MPKKKSKQLVMPGMPETPLSKAAEKAAEIVQDIAELKKDRDESFEQVLTEMEKEDRKSLTITVGADNYQFTIKAGKKSLRIVKQTRQPDPKAGENGKEKEPVAV